MSILSTSSNLIKVGQDYRAGSGISIDDHVISVTGEFGKTYSAGDNISIYEQGEHLYISSKDWSDDIANASANAYNEATAQIPDPFDPSYLSAQIDNKLNSSDFTTWQNGQYTTDLQTIEGQINNKLDTSSFSDVSGSFLTAHQSLDGYATEDWVTAQGYITGVDLSNYYTKDETSGKEELAQAFSDIPVGDPEVNAYVTNNSATINGTTDLVQNSSGLWNDVAVYQSNSANYLTAHQDISYKLDESAFADVSGTFLTAHQDLSNYYTTAEAETLSSMLSAAIDYVSANAGDPNALTGYQEDGCEISATSSFFGAKGDAGYVISTDPGIFEAKGQGYDLLVGYGGHLTANNSCSAKFENGCSAVFTNGSKFINTNNNFISADGSNGFVTSSNYHDLRIERAGKISANNRASAVFTNGAFISADGDKGFLFSSNYAIPIILSNGYNNNITLGNNNNGYTLSAGTPQYTAWIDNYGSYGLSGTNYIGSFGRWAGYNTLSNSLNGIGYNGGGTNFEVCNGSTASITNGSKLQLSMGATVSAVNAAVLQITNGSIISLDGTDKTYTFGFQGLAASGSRFVSADGEGVSAWKREPIIVLGEYNQTSSNAAFVIGNGSATTARSDLFVIDYSGNAQTNDFIAGNGAKLSDSIQTSELEFNADNAITAINGSAIGGGGVTGEFVPQSAFDELKQSYDALSSLFATYSGQWLLPNEGEE